MGMLKEQLNRSRELMGILNEQGKKYLVTGSKFCLYKQCNLIIKVTDISTAGIVFQTSAEGKGTEEELYTELVDKLSKNSEWKKLGVELIELKDFEDSSK